MADDPAPPARERALSGRGALLLAATLEAALLASLGWLPGLRATPLPALALWAGAFLAYAAAARLQGRAPVSPALVWGVGLGMRALLLPIPPHYSDDIYRFLWDGWVQRRGLDPYLHAPADPALEGIRTTWHSLINHPEIPTIYPPAAQLAFWSLALLGPSVLLFKVAWLGCDVGVALLVQRLAAGGPCRLSSGDAAEWPDGAEWPWAPAAGRRALLLYLWSPLAVVEVAWSGHLEPLAILPMLAAVAVLRASPRRGGPSDGPEGAAFPSAGPPGAGRRGLLAGVLLGLGAGVKLAPAAGLPALLRRHGVRAGAAALGILTLVSLPYLAGGAGPAAGLGAYAARWEFNAGAFRLLEALLGPGAAPRWVAVGGVATVAAATAWLRWPVARALFWTLGAALLLSPTLHPWYVLWILPFAALRESRGWLLMTGLVFMAYWGHDAFRATGVWPHPAGLAPLIHLPVLLLLAADSASGRRLASGARRLLGGGPPPPAGPRPPADDSPPPPADP